MYIAEQFVKSYGKDTAMTKLMDELEFVLVPFVNPDGYVVGELKKHMTYGTVMNMYLLP